MTAESFRLFDADREVAEEHRRKLNDIIDICSNWQARKGSVFAGFTYWGQFLAHETAPRPPDHPVRSSILDLDSVYGPVGVSPHPPVNMQTGELLVGPMRPGSSAPLDLLRDNKKRPLIPEQRNDENLIIAQFHLLMQRAHNSIVSKLFREGYRLPPLEMYERAKSMLITIFHRLTIDDYLETLLSPEIYRSIFEDRNRFFVWGPNKSTPLEITHAVFRFGHSQVLDSYSLNAGMKRVSLEEIFRLTGAGGLGGGSSIPGSHFVDWRSFFKVDAQTPQGTKPIDPVVSKALRGEHEIAKANLLAGINTALPSGNQVAKAVLETHPETKELGVWDWLNDNSPDNKKLLRDAGVYEKVPLWIFILAEADGIRAGKKLGPLGSLLVGEAVRNAVDNAAILLDLPHLTECEQILESGFTEMRNLVLFVEREEVLRR